MKINDLKEIDTNDLEEIMVSKKNPVKDIYWFERFCYHQHDEACNQKYDELPFSFHLKMVKAQAEKFVDLFYPNNTVDMSYKRALIFAGCAGHDLIEDARISFNDIKDKMGPDVAEIIFLCTEMRGRNRGERKNDQFYNDLVKNELAVFVKLCDIMANSLYSVLSNSTMLKKQKEEWSGIRIKLFPFHQQFVMMFDYLDKIYGL